MTSTPPPESDAASAVPPPPPAQAPVGTRRRMPVGPVSRRVRTLIVSGGLFVVLLVLAMTLPVPYVVLSPGQACNTLSGCYDETAITFTGRQAATTSGSLYLTTVEYSTGRLTVFNALSAYLQDDEVVVPRSAIFTPGQTTTQVDQQNTADFQLSQSDAVVAASCALGYPKAFGVIEVVPKGPSVGKLQPGDVFVSVAGQSATTFARLRAALATQQPGASVRVIVERAGRVTAETITLGKPLAGQRGGSIGVAVNNDTCLAPYGIDLGLGDQIGGPSAGLMFTLGIMEKAGRNVTHGLSVAGTGTIDPDTGAVGEIGGIQLKMIAAKRVGATVFLAPAGNCSDVRGNIPSGLDVIKVDTLNHALQYLTDVSEHKPVPHC